MNRSKSSNPIFPTLIAALLLAGCVNVHVHFPEAAPAATPAASESAPEEQKKK